MAADCDKRVGRAGAACDQRAVGGEHAGGDRAALAYQLDAEAADAMGDEAGNQRGGALGLGVEDGVSTSHVDQYGMDQADAIAKGDAVLFARAATAAVVAAGRQKMGVDAVLGVKGGNVMVNRDGEAASRNRGKKREHLRGVEIVCTGDCVEATGEEIPGGE